jgi:bifunctional ADP-heptose synthase (sugar kinase/adenylyltransferase)
MVDYVLIDGNAQPLENIAKLQPDFFAKGYEYVADGMPPKTTVEAEAVQAYGGTIIFTPGDIVYSSSRIIEASPPSLGIDKLLILMDRERIGFDDLRGALDRMVGWRVHVVGDTIVDSHTQTATIGAQGKTPTLSVLYQERLDYVGGAGIVAEHLRAAGAEVVFSTVLGDDALKDFVLARLRAAGIDVRACIDPTRPTTQKNVIVAQGHRLLKIDTLDNRSISDPILYDLVREISDITADAVVFTDFRHGIFNRRTIPVLVGAIPAGSYKVADSQVASRWGNITEFQDFDLITPNEREARFALGDQDSGIRPLAARIYDAARCRTLIVKLGDRGVLTCRHSDHEALDSFFVVDSFVATLADAVGAGDALLAYATLAMLATQSPPVATILGSMAAACECERDGNIPITPDDVRAKIDLVEKRASFQP